jgi:predicted ATPase
MAAEVLELANKQTTSFPLVIGHGFVGSSATLRGDIVEGREHLDQSIMFYDAAEHRQLAARFGEDQKVAHLCWRAWTLWMLGYPDNALEDSEQSIEDAEEISQAGTLMFALNFTSITQIQCGKYAAVKAQCAKAIGMADEKGASMWSAFGVLNQGCASALTGKAAEAVDVITSGIVAWRLTGATFLLPWWLTNLAIANADLGQSDQASRCVDEAITAVEATGEKCETEVNRVAGEIALKSLAPNTEKAEEYFDRALSVARQQQAKSWELRAATSLARLWRDQGKVSEARELLTPVYGWFTEGFDTRDLKEAKALLEELA